jgi:hypothetical protein
VLQLGSDFLASLNIVFSGVAALVALLLLWFTVVKGPSLELVSSFDPTPARSPQLTFQTDLTLGLNRIEIDPIGMVFVNDGSRSGAITSVEPNFLPSETFKQFYSRVGTQVWVKPEDPQQRTELPAIVSSGGTTVIGLSMTIYLKDWKDISRTSELLDTTLEQALKKIWDEGKKSLADFSKFKDEIGHVRLKVQRTRRHWGKIRTTDDDVGPSASIGMIPEWVRERAIPYCDRFGDLPPTDGEVARYIRGIPDFFINDLNSNIKTLKNAISDKSPNNLQLQGSDQLMVWKTRNDPYYQILLREKDLSRQISDYYAQAKQFQDRMLGFSLDLKKESPEMQALLAIMNRLLKQSEELLARLMTFKQELKDSTRHLIGKDLPS